MALHSLYCADVPLRNCSLTHVIYVLLYICKYCSESCCYLWNVGCSNCGRSLSRTLTFCHSSVPWKNSFCSVGENCSWLSSTKQTPCCLFHHPVLPSTVCLMLQFSSVRLYFSDDKQW